MAKKGNGDHPATIGLLIKEGDNQSMSIISEKLVPKGNKVLKKSKVEKCSKGWLHIGGIKLILSDRKAIINEQKLNDFAINIA